MQTAKCYHQSNPFTIDTKTALAFWLCFCNVKFFNSMIKIYYANTNRLKCCLATYSYLLRYHKQHQQTKPAVAAIPNNLRDHNHNWIISKIDKYLPIRRFMKEFLLRWNFPVSSLLSQKLKELIHHYIKSIMWSITPWSYDYKHIDVCEVTIRITVQWLCGACVLESVLKSVCAG